jgi:hypothetical protein
MTYHGVENWPPVWTWRGGMENKKPRGEIGILRDAFLSRIEPHAQLFLIIEHEDEEYIGCVMFDDGTFCGQVFASLKQHCGKTVVEIGNLDLGHLF